MKFKNAWDIAEVLFNTISDMSTTLCNEYCKYQAEFETKHGYNIDEAPYEEMDDFSKNHCDKCPFRWYQGCAFDDDYYTLIGKDMP